MVRLSFVPVVRERASTSQEPGGAEQGCGRGDAIISRRRVQLIGRAVVENQGREVAVELKGKPWKVFSVKWFRAINREDLKVEEQGKVAPAGSRAPSARQHTDFKPITGPPTEAARQTDVRSFSALEVDPWSLRKLGFRPEVARRPGTTTRRGSRLPRSSHRALMGIPSTAKVQAGLKSLTFAMTTRVSNQDFPPDKAPSSPVHG